jgi:hypothetical protein
MRVRDGTLGSAGVASFPSLVAWIWSAVPLNLLLCETTPFKCRILLETYLPPDTQQNGYR